MHTWTNDTKSYSSPCQRLTVNPGHGGCCRVTLIVPAYERSIHPDLTLGVWWENSPLQPVLSGMVSKRRKGFVQSHFPSCRHVLAKAWTSYSNRDQLWRVPVKAPLFPFAHTSVLFLPSRGASFTSIEFPTSHTPLYLNVLPRDSAFWRLRFLG